MTGSIPRKRWKIVTDTRSYQLRHLQLRVLMAKENGHSPDHIIAVVRNTLARFPGPQELKEYWKTND